MNSANPMSVTGILGGEYPQLTQDGFMLESEYQAQQAQGRARPGGVVQSVQGGGTWNEWRGGEAHH